MSSHQEVGGVALAFAGFAFLVLAFKGTWHNVYLAALGQTPSSTDNAKPAGSSPAHTGASSPVAGMPGGAPATTTPTARSVRA